MKPTIDMMTTVRIKIAVKMLVTVKHLNESYTIIAMFNSSRYMTLYALRVSTSVLFIGKI